MVFFVIHFFYGHTAVPVYATPTVTGGVSKNMGAPDAVALENIAYATSLSHAPELKVTVIS